MNRLAIRLVIRGQVQGVGYRWWAHGQARSLGLDGWVRNRLDGTVELVAAGPGPAIARLAAACRLGPPAAEVEAVERHDAEDQDLPVFEERPTA